MWELFGVNLSDSVGIIAPSWIKYGDFFIYCFWFQFFENNVPFLYAVCLLRLLENAFGHKLMTLLLFDIVSADHGCCMRIKVNSDRA